MLFAYGARVLSRGKTVTVPIGTASGTLVNITSDDLYQYAGATGGTATFRVDLGSAQQPDLAGVFNHNLTGTVRLLGSSNANLSSPSVDVAMMVARPNFWVDLRALSGRNVRYWGVEVSGSTGAIRIGKIALATVVEVWAYQWGFTNRDIYLERAGGVTDLGVLHRQKMGIKVRARDVTLVGPQGVETTLRAIALHTAKQPGPVIAVPQSEENDIWWCDWQDGHSYKQLADNRREVALQLQEQSPGTLT